MLAFVVNGLYPPKFNVGLLTVHATATVAVTLSVPLEDDALPGCGSTIATAAKTVAARHFARRIPPFMR